MGWIFFDKSVLAIQIMEGALFILRFLHISKMPLHISPTAISFSAQV